MPLAFTDPAGRGFLNDAAAEAEYQTIIDRFYTTFANRPDTAFVHLERIQDLLALPEAQRATVDWLAYPLTAFATDSEIDAERFQFQDEYVEWWVEEDGNGAIVRITFVTELPEYFQAFARAGTANLAAAIRDVLPGANPTAAELFGSGLIVDADSLSPSERERRFRSNLTQNPWNNGEKGILCLTQRFNTMNALFNLVTECAVPHDQGAAENTCGLVGGACGPGRASDPVICTAAQNQARNDNVLTLADPVGIQILSLQGSWEFDGQFISINDPQQPLNLWRVERGGRRAVLEVPAGLLVNGNPITSGSQVARLVRVGAHVVTLPRATASPGTDQPREAIRMARL